MISVNFEKEGLAAVGKQGLRRAGKVAIAKAAAYWHKTFLPIHFTKRASKRYNYVYRHGQANLRPGSYSWLKLKRRSIAGIQSIGEVKPLVWSGRSRERALQHRSFTGRATDYRNYRGHAAINAPALNFLVRIHPEMGYDEVTRTTPDEDAALREVFVREFERQLEQQKQTRSKKTKG